MSQFPPPHSPQQPAYGGYPPPRPPESPEMLLGHARRAGVLMIGIGVLFVLGALCVGFMSWFINQQEFTSSPEYAEMRKLLEQVETQSGTSVQTVLLISGIIPLVVGAVFGGLGFFVRGGGLVPLIIATAATVGLELFFLLEITMVLLQAMMGQPAALGGFCVFGLPFALLGVLLVSLVQALRASSRVALARQQYQAQLWQYQQLQQAYLQQGQPSQPPGLGYHAVPPPQGPGTPAPASTENTPERKDPPHGASPEG